MTEINNLDHAIEISIKKYLYSQIFKKGTQKMPALVPHPTVSGKAWTQHYYTLGFVLILLSIAMKCPNFPEII